MLVQPGVGAGAADGSQALSKLIPWRFGCFATTSKFRVDLLKSLYVVLFMINSGLAMAQILTDGATKLTNLSENNATLFSKKEPIGIFRISSPFGWRIDPRTGRWALHRGVDIAGKKVVPY